MKDGRIINLKQSQAKPNRLTTVQVANLESHFFELKIPVAPTLANLRNMREVICNELEYNADCRDSNAAGFRVNQEF